MKLVSSVCVAPTNHKWKWSEIQDAKTSASEGLEAFPFLCLWDMNLVTTSLVIMKS
jgi:hypothetical protein